METMNFERAEHIARLVALTVTGEATEAQRRELDAWRAERPENGAMLTRMLSRTEFERNVTRFANDRTGTPRAVSRTPRHTRWIRRTAAAAAVAVIVTAGWWALRERPEAAVGQTIARVESSPVLVLGDGRQVELAAGSDRTALGDEHMTLDTTAMTLVYDADTQSVPATHTLIVPRGSDYRIVLGDGTAVHLNAGSTLVYPSVFAGAQRRVELTGEACFEVAPDAAHPVVVAAADMEVRATGTTFDVRAYGDEAQVRAVLVEGGVEVTAGIHTLTLLPGMQALYNPADGGMTAGQADVETLLAWRNDRFAYDAATLEEIFADLGRWYDFEVEWGDEASRRVRYSLDIRRREGFEAVLRIIGATRKVDFTIDGRRVVARTRM
jgi:ferric-dicitrate binding protein FerR (iron transport regulator)